MNGQSILLHDNIRGLMVLKRPSELQQLKASLPSPFISRVTAKESLGLPPIMNTIVSNQNKQNNSEYNSKILLKQLHKYPKKTDKNYKIKLAKLLAKSNKLNDEIGCRDFVDTKNENLFSNINPKETIMGFSNNLIEREKTPPNNAYNNDNCSDNLDVEYSQKSSSNQEFKTNLKVDDLDGDENELEVNKMLEFVNNLDYDKYEKDLQVRENLYVIKNDLEKEKSQSIQEEEKLPDIYIDRPLQTEENIKFSQTASEKSNHINHDKGWDNCVLIINLV